MKVSQFHNKNQFVLEISDDIELFQSYKSIVAGRINGDIYLDRDTYDYSKTTAKFRNRYLNVTNDEFKKHVKSGKYNIVDNLEKFAEGAMES